MMQRFITHLRTPFNDTLGSSRQWTKHPAWTAAPYGLMPRLRPCCECTSSAVRHLKTESSHHHSLITCIDGVSENQVRTSMTAAREFKRFEHILLYWWNYVRLLVTVVSYYHVKLHTFPQLIVNHQNYRQTNMPVFWQSPSRQLHHNQ
jgi:hypothetical protein